MCCIRFALVANLALFESQRVPFGEQYELLLRVCARARDDHRSYKCFVQSDYGAPWRKEQLASQNSLSKGSAKRSIRVRHLIGRMNAHFDAELRLATVTLTGVKQTNAF